MSKISFIFFGSVTEPFHYNYITTILMNLYQTILNLVTDTFACFQDHTVSLAPLAHQVLTQMGHTKTNVFRIIKLEWVMLNVVTSAKLVCCAKNHLVYICSVKVCIVLYKREFNKENLSGIFVCLSCHILLSSQRQFVSMYCKPS